jgi:hypothetical protein
MIVVCVVAMCWFAANSFKAKYSKQEPEMELTDPIAQRLYAISKIGYSSEMKRAIQKLSIDNDVIVDSIYQRMLRDTVFLNKVAEVFINIPNNELLTIKREK